MMTIGETNGMATFQSGPRIRFNRRARNTAGLRTADVLGSAVLAISILFRG